MKMTCLLDCCAIVSQELNDASEMRTAFVIGAVHRPDDERWSISTRLHGAETQKTSLYSAPRKPETRFQRFGDCLCLHHQGLYVRWKLTLFSHG
jgi:hypothetical protein